ncbi:DUF4102 domain-containing protein [Sphingomonas populi]|uniref:DUF4102 domain-containing protein n=1 Tax=Sphingomonas populi TaxID=2484750 RepID=A0A4Q6XU35_9SPHN|nr:Arm DNA-binding domain-containing protein [Sphingomonas populi]RZF61132.1 DUF4102 domain-containing protein [Sphingomonas populi]
MPLSFAAINAALLRGKPYKPSDRHGFYLHVAASGTKSWRYT